MYVHPERLMNTAPLNEGSEKNLAEFVRAAEEAVGIGSYIKQIGDYQDQFLRLADRIKMADDEFFELTEDDRIALLPEEEKKKIFSEYQEHVENLKKASTELYALILQSLSLTDTRITGPQSRPLFLGLQKTLDKEFERQINKSFENLSRLQEKYAAASGIWFQRIAETKGYVDAARAAITQCSQIGSVDYAAQSKGLLKSFFRSADRQFQVNALTDMAQYLQRSTDLSSREKLLILLGLYQTIMSQIEIPKTSNLYKDLGPAMEDIHRQLMVLDKNYNFENITLEANNKFKDELPKLRTAGALKDIDEKFIVRMETAVQDVTADKSPVKLVDKEVSKKMKQLHESHQATEAAVKEALPDYINTLSQWAKKQEEEELPAGDPDIVASLRTMGILLTQMGALEAFREQNVRDFHSPTGNEIQRKIDSLLVDYDKLRSHLMTEAEKDHKRAEIEGNEMYDNVMTKLPPKDETRQEMEERMRLDKPQFNVIKSLQYALNKADIEAPQIAREDSPRAVKKR